MPKCKLDEAETRVKVEAAIADGWPLIEIRRTYGVDRRTIIRHYGYRGWDKQQSATFGAYMLHSSRS
jgi:hypothetical protein